MLREVLNKLSKDCVIIIDEFDSPVIDSMDDPKKLENVRKTFSSFYSIIKNMGKKVRFFFITGVTKLSNMSIFSKMNNLKDISMDPRFASAFGYTEEELLSYFSEHIENYLESENCPYKSKKDFIDEIRDYYDGYQFSYRSPLKVYNPVSIGLFFSNGCELANYWETTGVSTLAVELAKKYDLLSLVVENPFAEFSAFTSFDISEIVSSDLTVYGVYALLYYTGYLTIENSNTYGLFLKFPNKEISSSFSKSLITWYMKKGLSVVPLILKASEYLDSGDTEAFISVLKEYYESFPYDLLDKAKEKSYHLIFHGFFLAAGYRVSSEDRNIRGRADSVIETKRSICIFEIKLDKTTKTAIDQIKEKEYYSKYISRSREKGLSIHLIGINFSSKKRNIVSYKEEELNY